MKRISVFSKLLCLYFCVYMALPHSNVAVAALTLAHPTFPNSNTVRVTLDGTDTNSYVYTVFYAPELFSSNTPWFIGATGAVGQTVFDLPKTTNENMFFAAQGTVLPITETVATPVFVPGGGAYSSPQLISVSCSTLGASIYWTTNGNTPTPTDNFIYSGGTLSLDRTRTLKAKAFKPGASDSAVAVAVYNINAPPTVTGGNQQILTTTTTTLQGFCADDGLPTGSSLTNTWSKISGPSTVSFGNASQTNSSATFGANGIYVLQLASTDGQYTTTNRVTIAVNTTLSVSLTEPGIGSTFTVPTNIVLQGIAECSSGTVTQMAFYADSTLIGSSSSEPFSFHWRSVPRGNHALRAVAYTTDTNNTGLASSPVNISVTWPTNVGQFVTSAEDIEVPVAGFPIAINRLYDTRFGSEGSVGQNWKLDYEQIRIEKTASLGDGYTALNTGTAHCIEPDHETLVTVSLSDTEKYHFRPQVMFQSGGGVACLGQSSVTYLANILYRFHSVSGLGQLQDVNAPGDVGMMNENALFGSWSGTIRPGTEDSFEIEDYEPDWTLFTFIAPDGTKYEFDSSGALRRKTDRNGNYLDFGYSGITHSSGKQISFTRSGNRITEVYDPISIETSGSPAIVYSYSSSGNLTNISKLVSRNPVTYESTGIEYSNASFPHYITKIIDPRNSPVTRNIFDSSGRLEQQLDALGNPTSYFFDETGQRQATTNRLGRAVVHHFTDSGQLERTVNQEGAAITFFYDENGRRIEERNELGNPKYFGYDAKDQLVASTNEVGAFTSSTYDAFGQPLIVIDALGNGTTNGYDSNGNLLATTNALSFVTRYGYDSQGNRTAETNAFGTSFQAVTTYQYNEFGYLTNVTDALNNATAYSYDSNGNRLTQTKKRTASAGLETLVTSFYYDAANRVTNTVHPDGFTNHVIYNSIGKEYATVDKLNRTNFFHYDARGLLTNITFPDGLSERFSYDAEERRTNYVDRGSRTNSYSYDHVGRLKKTTYPDTGYVENVYNAAGQLVRVITGPNVAVSPPNISASPLVVAYGYDAAGRRTAITNGPAGAPQIITYFAFDANGNRTNTVDNLGRTNTYRFDKLNREVAVIFPDGTSETTGYDPLERRSAVTNQATTVTRFGYDVIGRLTSVTNNFGGTPTLITSYKYDQIGNLTNVIDGLNRTNIFLYDKVGRKTKEVMPGSQAQTFGYDPVGNLILHTNFNGVIITNQYSSLNQLTNRMSGPYQISFAYSAASMRTNMVDMLGISTYTYDARDRLRTKNTPQGNLSYDYDSLGNLKTIQSTNQSGTLVTYKYDSLARLTNVVDRFTNSTSYGFDGVGSLQTVRYPNAVTNVYSYSSLNRLTNISVTTVAGQLATFGYKIAAAGNRTNLSENINGVGRTTAWSYDPLFRLTNEVMSGSAPTGSIGYKYDSVGNRTNRTSTVTGVSTTNQTFNANDWLTTDSYDSNGNTLSSGGASYQYDLENRLTNYNNGAVIYQYDGDGNRVRKTSGGTTTYFLVDDKNPSGYVQVLEEFTSFGDTPKVYTYGLDLISQRQTNGTLSYYGYDGNGSVRYLTSSSGTVSDTYTYDAFGITISSTGTTPNNYRYSGEQYDPNLGFYHLRSRDLNPGTGRFLTRDTFAGSIFDPPSLHKYTYVHNSPIDHADPSGKELLGNVLIALVVVAVIILSYISYKTGGKIQKQKATNADFQTLIKILERGITQMEANLEGNPQTTQELFRNLTPVGQRGSFTGVVTERGKQQSEGVQNLIKYLENASEFNNLPGAGNRESPLQEYQSVERAKIGLEAEISRSKKAIEVLTKEMQRRGGN